MTQQSCALPADQERVLEMIRAAARYHRECPSNGMIAEKLGCGPSRASTLVTALERRGIIQVIRYTASRVAIIPAEGLRTAGGGGTLHWSSRGITPIRPDAGECRLPTAPVPDRYVVTDRDPCFFCGVRADKGCAHRAASEPVEML